MFFFCNTTVISRFPLHQMLPQSWDYSHAALDLVAGLRVLFVLRSLFPASDSRPIVFSLSAPTECRSRIKAWVRNYKSGIAGKDPEVHYMGKFSLWFTQTSLSHYCLVSQETNLCLSQWPVVIFKVPWDLRIVPLCSQCQRQECHANTITLLENCWIKGSS